LIVLVLVAGRNPPPLGRRYHAQVVQASLFNL
jgi:hypothetical protein